MNGSNFMDGINTLLVGYFLSLSVITFISIEKFNLPYDISNLKILVSILIVVISFNFFGKLISGDSGAYLFGSLVALNTVITNNLIASISSLFFCSLLFYPFFEVFFSFFRKIYQRKSPLYPDKEHLHMLSFYKISHIYGLNKANYLNSIIINFIYLILIIPGLYLSDNPQLSRYWFFILLLVYLMIYLRLYRLTKN